VVFTVDPRASTKRLQRQLENMIRSLERPREAHKAASIVMHNFVIRNIDSGGELVGGWAPLAESTIREKKRIGKSKPMIRSGALRNSFTPFDTDQGGGVRSELFYVPFQNFGTRKIPARRLIPNERETLKEVLPIYAAFVKRAAKKAVGIK